MRANLAPIPLKAPKGGHRRLPHVGEAFEEGVSRKGRSSRQEICPTFVKLCCLMWEAQPKEGRRPGGSTIEPGGFKIEAGGSKIEAWRLQNRGLEAPKSTQEPSKTPFLKDF